MIVIDANMALSWFIDERPHAESDAVLDEVGDGGARAPANFFLEVAHGLLRAERRQRSSESLSVAALGEIMSLEISVDLPDPHLVLTLAREHGLSCYDASYLAVAMERELPLATADSALRAAAKNLKLLWAPPPADR